MGARAQWIVVLICVVVSTAMSVHFWTLTHGSDVVRLSAVTGSCSTSGPRGKNDCPAVFSRDGKTYKVETGAQSAGQHVSLYVRQSALDKGYVGPDDAARHSYVWVWYVATVVLWLVLALMIAAQVKRTRLRRTAAAA